MNTVASSAFWRFEAKRCNNLVLLFLKSLFLLGYLEFIHGSVVQDIWTHESLHDNLAFELNFWAVGKWNSGSHYDLVMRHNLVVYSTIFSREKAMQLWSCSVLASAWIHRAGFISQFWFQRFFVTDTLLGRSALGRDIILVLVKNLSKGVAIDLILIGLYIFVLLFL